MSSVLEVRVYNFLRQWRGKNFLLAVSGGRDSMAMLKVFASLAPKLSLRFSVGYVHHGPSEDKLQLDFRNQCFKLLSEYCRIHGIPFVCNIEKNSEGALLPPLKNSEAEFRRFRKICFKKFIEQGAYDFLVLAHHQDDLFETRLIRMLRGTGPQGLVAMTMQKGRVLRPFLELPKAELHGYLGESAYCEDPSNHTTHYLRNWLRKTWLPQLEKKRPGAAKSLQQSLELCLEALQTTPSLDFCIDENMHVLRNEYTGLSTPEKKRVWAQYLKQVGVKDYGLSHINELVKRLDVEQKDLTFVLLKKRWLANARHIWCESKNALE